MGFSVDPKSRQGTRIPTFPNKHVHVARAVAPITGSRRDNQS